MRRREMNWIWAIGAPLVYTLLAGLFRLRIEGIANVPRMGAVIVAPNHLSVLDGPAISAVTGTRRRRAIRNLIAAEVFDGSFGWILRQARQVPIRRGSGDTSALDEAVAAAAEGSCVGIFPEGRVSEDAATGLQRIRSGLTRIAIPSRTPVVPVGIWGTQAVWSRAGIDRAGLLRRPTLSIVYGEPIVPDGGEAPGEFRERYRIGLQTVLTRAKALAETTS
jgi:1-acyl-sn-glycerol-3-phosphate acyltransferase